MTGLCFHNWAKLLKLTVGHNLSANIVTPKKEVLLSILKKSRSTFNLLANEENLKFLSLYLCIYYALLCNFIVNISHEVKRN